jgi:hypothetical protein
MISDRGMYNPSENGIPQKRSDYHPDYPSIVEGSVATTARHVFESHNNNLGR